MFYRNDLTGLDPYEVLKWVGTLAKCRFCFTVALCSYEQNPYSWGCPRCGWLIKEIDPSRPDRT